jgi:tRNA(Arg) A34 adenosine deaminase TadA
MFTPNRIFMLAAIESAHESRAAGDYAVGSTVAKEGRIVSTAGNRTHLDADATQHAEMIAIREAARRLGTKDLSGCILYATHEPCAMCMGAVVWSRIPCVVHGATIADHKQYRDAHGNERWRWRIIDLPASLIAAQSDPAVELISGFMREECLALFHSS